MDTNNYIEPSAERDNADLAKLALGMLRLTRCPGGRYNPKGYICMHCGVDYTDEGNESFCGQPVEEDGFTPFDATVARRRMREHMDKYGEEL